MKDFEIHPMSEEELKEWDAKRLETPTFIVEKFTDHSQESLVGSEKTKTSFHTDLLRNSPETVQNEEILQELSDFLEIEFFSSPKMELSLEYSDAEKILLEVAE